MYRTALRFAGIAGIAASAMAGAPVYAQAPSFTPRAARAELPAEPPASTAAVPPATLLMGAPAVSDWLPAEARSGQRTGPTSEAASAAVRRPMTTLSAADSAALLQTRRRGFGQSQVLMIVGGAAFLTGAIIGDDAGTIIMIGGAAVGLYGLYQYLQGR